MATHQATLMICLLHLLLGPCPTYIPVADMGYFYMSNRQLHRDGKGYDTLKELRGTQFYIL